jgi:hypothetical protein
MLEILLFFAYAILYVVSYVALFILFTAFFDRPRFPSRSRAAITLLQIIAILAIVFLIVHSIADSWWSNRIQHALAGGGTAFFMCWRILIDARIKLSKFRALFFCFLVVLALGVANELAESIVQGMTQLVFSPTSTDTWLDLWSNTVGALAAGALVFVFRIERSR